jgi:hypothetical protein
MYSPNRPPSFCHLNDIWWRLNLLSCSLYKFFHPKVSSSRLRSKFLSTTSFSDSLTSDHSDKRGRKFCIKIEQPLTLRTLHFLQNTNSIFRSLYLMLTCTVVESRESLWAQIFVRVLSVLFCDFLSIYPILYRVPIATYEQKCRTHLEHRIPRTTLLHRPHIIMHYYCCSIQFFY